MPYVNFNFTESSISLFITMPIIPLFNHCQKLQGIKQKRQHQQQHHPLWRLSLQPLDSHRRLCPASQDYAGCALYSPAS